RELAFRLARINEAGRVRDEFTGEHYVRHIPIESIAFLRVGLGGRDVSDDSTDDIIPSFERFAFFILDRITLGYHLLGVQAEGLIGSSRGCRSVRRYSF